MLMLEQGLVQDRALKLEQGGGWRPPTPRTSGGPHVRPGARRRRQAPRQAASRIKASRPGKQRLGCGGGAGGTSF